MPELTPVPLDVRGVAPKDRFGTIIGAYEALPIGGVLDLTVDHDPACMYYTLRATHGPETFSIDYREKGPEVWRVEVTRLGQPATGGVVAEK